MRGMTEERRSRTVVVLSNGPGLPTNMDGEVVLCHRRGRGHATLSFRHTFFSCTSWGPYGKARAYTPISRSPIH